jgi:dynein heavy chain 1, cytosolic
MEVLTPSAPNGNGVTPTIEPADPIAVLDHIVSLIETALGAARKELEAVGSLLSDTKRAETIDRVSQFAADTQVSLYAQKDRRDELVNGHGDTPGMAIIPLASFH